MLLTCLPHKYNICISLYPPWVQFIGSLTTAQMMCTLKLYLETVIGRFFGVDFLASADVERDQMQAKMPLYMHISVYIQAFNNK